MSTTEILTAIAVIGTIWGFIIGYKTKKIIDNQREAKWWSEMTLEDSLSETPIYNKLKREYGNLF